MPSLAASSQLLNAIKHCTKVHKTGVASKEANNLATVYEYWLKYSFAVTPGRHWGTPTDATARMITQWPDVGNAQQFSNRCTKMDPDQICKMSGIMFRFSSLTSTVSTTVITHRCAHHKHTAFLATMHVVADRWQHHHNRLSVLCTSSLKIFNKTGMALPTCYTQPEICWPARTNRCTLSWSSHLDLWDKVDLVICKIRQNHKQ